MVSVLEIENLAHEVKPHFWSRRRPILQNVSLCIAQGEVFGFLGPNGAGKTTTIKAVLGLLSPSGGTISVLGGKSDDVTTRRRLGYMPERAYFPEQLTARELCIEHGLLSGLSFADAKQKALHVLDRVGLGDARDDRLRTYSKGMLQRAGLAQALVGDPELVVLDEPMSGLDPIGRRDIREIMQELRAQGRTVFFSTHILPDVEIICDRVGIIVAGRTIKSGRLDELLGGSIEHVEVACDLCEPTLQERAKKLARTIEVHGDEVIFQVEDSSDANELIDLLRQSGVAIRYVQPIRRSLEDLFMREAAS